MCTFGLSGSKRAHWRVLALHEKNLRREDKMKIVVERKKKARNFGPPSLQGPTLQGPSLAGQNGCQPNLVLTKVGV